ncbi:unnamed protein product [Ceratitis capitata]|uniref:(Mediterranean fruit fly) hypothetical protein n=1 Tax=Ceratitis capitata TaxID=7213 RepID=A0A811VEA2_CERCA|nr:unnamed protein product [Ceratitis capitata]
MFIVDCPCDKLLRLQSTQLLFLMLKCRFKAQVSWLQHNHNHKHECIHICVCVFRNYIAFVYVRFCLRFRVIACAAPGGMFIQVILSLTHHSHINPIHAD